MSMDRCHTIYRWGPLIAGLAIGLAACRGPVAPVEMGPTIGSIYDTSMEDEIRSGKAHPLVMDSYGPYVDTLAEPVAVTRWVDTQSDWELFIATNRAVFATDDAPAAPNRVLDHVQYGRCVVTLPQKRRGTEVQVASEAKSTLISSLKQRVAGTPAAYASVAAESLPVEEFIAGITVQVSRSRQKDLLLFVHGFNVNFEAAVTRAAQLGRDIPFNGAVVAYCWPTQGGVSNYEADEPINRASVAPFQEFLVTLRNGIPEETRIQIVVHSMGNRIVLQALDQLPTVRGPRPIDHLLLCSPDVGLADYKKWIPGVVAQCDRVTLYANQSDSALIASKGVHAEARAGDAAHRLLAPGVEYIDCSRIDTSFMGHSYYGSNPDMLTELFQTLKEAKTAEQRPHLTEMSTPEGPYWEFARPAGLMHYAWHFDE